MHKGLFLPIFISILNVFAGLAINNAAAIISLPLPGSVLLSLALICTFLCVILGESLGSSTFHRGSASLLWFSGLLTLGGALLFFYALPKSQDVSPVFELIVGYTSLILFVIGVALPPLLIFLQRPKASSDTHNSQNTTTSFSESPSSQSEAARSSPSSPNELLPLPPTEDSSPTIGLTAEVVQELVKLLEPHMRHERQRRSLLRMSVGDLPVLRDLDWSGSANTFIPEMIDRLASFGKLSSGQPALLVLLQYIRSQYSPSKQREIDTLSTRIFRTTQE